MKRILLLAVAAIFALNVNAQIFSEDFESTPGEVPAGWLTVTPTYATIATNWHPTEYDDNDALRASSFFESQNWETEQWIVTPSFSTSHSPFSL